MVSTTDLTTLNLEMDMELAKVYTALNLLDFVHDNLYETPVEGNESLCKAIDTFYVGLNALQGCYEKLGEINSAYIHFDTELRKAMGVSVDE